MHRLWTVLLAVGLALPAFAQSESKTEEKRPDPAVTYKEIVDGYDKARRTYFARYRAAKTPQEKREIGKTYPRADGPAKKLLALATEHPKHAVAVKALAWVARQNLYGQSARLKTQALERLAADHIESAELYGVCQYLTWGRDAASAALLKAALEKSPHRKVKAAACFALAKRTKNIARGNPDKLQEAIAALERVVREFPEQKWFVKQAKAALRELRFLSPGKQAPEVTGVDLDGKPLKLSDFRGKVVVFYFWGHW